MKKITPIALITIISILGIVFLGNYKTSRNIDNLHNYALDPNYHFNSSDCVKGKSKAISGYVKEKKNDFLIVASPGEEERLHKIYTIPSTVYLEIISEKNIANSEKEVDFNYLKQNDSVVISTFCLEKSERYEAMLVKIIKEK